MSQELWTAVDRYLVESLIPHDPLLEEVLKANVAAGLPTIDVAPNQGKLLHLLARIQGAKRILEIGTLGGYSGIWIARALAPGGQLITIEKDHRHAAFAFPDGGLRTLAGTPDRSECAGRCKSSESTSTP